MVVGRAILNKHLGKEGVDRMVQAVGTMTLRELQPMAPAQLTPDYLARSAMT